MENSERGPHFVHWVYVMLCYVKQLPEHTEYAHTQPKGLLYANKFHQGQPFFSVAPTSLCSFLTVDSDDYNGAISQNSTMT